MCCVCCGAVHAVPGEHAMHAANSSVALPAALPPFMHACWLTLPGLRSRPLPH